MATRSYIGIDVSKDRLDVAVLGEEGGWPVDTTQAGIVNLVQQLQELQPELIVVEATGGYQRRVVDALFQAGLCVAVVNPARVRQFARACGLLAKTDKLDARGLTTLLRNGTLPTVWIAPSEIRDERELPRTRMALCKIRVALKNRIHATLAKYNLSLHTESDIFAPKWSNQLNQVIEQLPPETQNCLQQELELLEGVQGQIQAMEERMKERISLTPEMQLLKTIPGVGDILAMVIGTEIGLIERFIRAEQLASYAGTVPAVKSSGGKVRYGHTPKESNHYLKWAFIEAANAPAQYGKKPHWQHRHVTYLYARVKQRKGHSVAVGAVARHLAEATFWILSKQEPYREPIRQKVLPKQA